VTSPDDANKQLLGGFAHVDDSTSRQFSSRLDAMHALEFFKAYKRQTFALMRIGAGSRVGDIGCGTGEDAKNLSEIVGVHGDATGFDISEAMLREARLRYANVHNLAFVLSGADRLDAPTAYFDAVRLDRVLTHVPDIPAVFAELRRIVKPGGRIVISEPDMPGIWQSSRHPQLSAKIFRAIADSCAQPYAARNLYPTFSDTGLIEVELHLHSAAVADPSTAETILNFEATIKVMLAAGTLTTEESALWINEFEEQRRQARFLGGITVFVVAGTNPGTDAQ
jgi:ubiquinone/menaquinone biosynthesis C-methylase UbiE